MVQKHWRGGNITKKIGYLNPISIPKLGLFQLLFMLSGFLIGFAGCSGEAENALSGGRFTIKQRGKSEVTRRRENHAGEEQNEPRLDGNKR
jgi:hypothetical protein